MLLKLEQCLSEGWMPTDAAFTMGIIGAAAVFVFLFLMVLLLRKKMWTPMRMIPIILFVSIAVFLFPVAYKTDVFLSAETTEYRGVFAVFLSLLQAARMFLVDGEYGEIIAFFSSCRDASLSSWAHICFTSISVLAPLSTAAFALSFVGELRVWVRTKLLWGKRVYVFNELSERSLALAQSIRDNIETDVYEERHGSKGKVLARKGLSRWWHTMVMNMRKWHIRHQPVYFFADVFSDGKEGEYDYVQMLKGFGGAYDCKRDILALDKMIRRKRWFKPRAVEYFLVSEDEGENLNQAITMAQYEAPLGSVVPKIYVVASGTTAPSIIDSLNRFMIDPTKIEAYLNTKKMMKKDALPGQKNTVTVKKASGEKPTWFPWLFKKPQTGLVSMGENAEVAQMLEGLSSNKDHLPHNDVGSAPAEDWMSPAELRRYGKLYEKLRRSLPPILVDPSQSSSLKELGAAASEGWQCTEKLKTFCVRRVHPMQYLAWKQLSDVYRKQFSVIRGEKHISLMIVGCGGHGVEFLKTALWLFQLPDVHLEINVVDLDESVQDKVEGMCADIMRVSDSPESGECQYSLRFFGGMNVMHRSFWEALSAPETVAAHKDIERLRRTNVIVVALGDDDLDIDAAVQLRMLFDRLHNQTARGKADKPDRNLHILSIVYNKDKIQNVQSGLSDFRGNSYDIHFIGDVIQMYEYSTFTHRKNERESYKGHIRWYYNWREKRQLVEHYNPIAKLFDYNRFEYFRMASMAQELHMQFFNPETYKDYFEQSGPDAGLRNKRGCEVEHRRWNAFMRTMGYVYGPTRNDRAKQHDALVAFDKLPAEYWKNDR